MAGIPTDGEEQMTHWLRHLTARLWITLMIGTAATLGLMLLLQPTIGFEAAPGVAAVLMIALFFVVGGAASRWGRWRVRRLLAAAEEAERDGLRIAAAVLFDRARAVLDSFLISPAVRRRRLPALYARLARFHLDSPDGRGVRAAFIRHYLTVTPGDEEVAEQWVVEMERCGGLAEEDLGFAARLAAAHTRNEGIQKTLARMYLAQESADYAALQCYRRVCTGAETPDQGFCRAVARLLRTTACNDPWARQLVHQFFGTEPAVREPPAVPAVAPLPPGGAAPRARVAEAAGVVTAEDDDGGFFRMSAFPDEPEDEEETEERPHPLAAAGAAMGAIREGTGRLVAGLIRCAAGARCRALRAAAGVRAAPWRRTAGLCGLGAALLAGGLWFWGNEIRLLREDSESPAAVASESAPPPLVMDRFTLQVAAYLKAEHAYKFVDQLKRQGFDAYLTETVSGGKTWYQVRIAHFPDRPSARDFGGRLKQKGVIEDFYVTLYSR